MYSGFKFLKTTTVRPSWWFNPVTNSNLKHTDVRHDFLRGHVENGELKISHVQSNYQDADFLTKILAKDAFRFNKKLITNMS